MLDVTGSSLGWLIRQLGGENTLYWVQVPATTANTLIGYANHNLTPEREGIDRRKGVTQDYVTR